MKYYNGCLFYNVQQNFIGTNRRSCYFYLLRNLQFLFMQPKLVTPQALDVEETLCMVRCMGRKRPLLRRKC